MRTKALRVPAVSYTNEQFSQSDELSLMSMHSPDVYTSNTERDTVMYSFNRPADAFWHGFQMQLYKSGYTQVQVQDILRSKLMRHLFDGSADDTLTAVGFAVAKDFLKKDMSEIDRLMQQIERDNRLDSAKTIKEVNSGKG